MTPLYMVCFTSFHVMYTDARPYNLVPVNGMPKAFSEVTEEDHGLMTPEEYTAYFEVFEVRASY